MALYKTGVVEATGFHEYASSMVLVGSNAVVDSNGIFTTTNANSYLNTNWRYIDPVPFEIQVKIKTGSNVNTEQGIFMPISASPYQQYLNLWLYFNKITVALNGPNGSINSYSDNPIVPTITTSTVYWVRVKWTGTQYIFSYSTDGSTYTTTQTLNSSKPIYYGVNNQLFQLGTARGVDRPFLGEIDLKEFWIKQNGTYVIRGIEYVESKNKLRFNKDLTISSTEFYEI